MLKEIAEQPQAIADTLLGRLGAHGELVLDEVRLSDQELRDIDKIFVVACGTAYHAGLIAKYAIEHWTRIPVEVELASEFRYRDPVLDRSTLVVVISQSGETMDTLMALRHAREQHARVLAICNANGSTIPRESDAVLYTHAGPEVAVASTKGFLTQVVACYLVGLFLAQVRGVKYEDEVSAIVADLRRLPEAVAEVLAGMEPVRELARSLADANTILFLGRHVGYPVALEGALKLKELAYIHAEGFAAGELKHGPIAVVDQGTPGDHRRPVAPQPGVRARQGHLQHPGGPCPRGADDRHRRGGRRRGGALRRPRHPGAAHPDAARARWSRPCRCRCSRARSPTPAAWTSTSPGTSPSPSPWSRPDACEAAGRGRAGRSACSSRRCCCSPWPATSRAASRPVRRRRRSPPVRPRRPPATTRVAAATSRAAAGGARHGRLTA